MSGDARDCGDIVVHGIAATARRNRAAFYWHLGDLRRTFGRDQDMLHQPEHIETPLSIDDYHAIERQDSSTTRSRPLARSPTSSASATTT